jgi:predicted nucleotidyltransferase
MALFRPVFAALNTAGVRYVIVGGVAVVLHGHPRLTADVDLVLDLEPNAARRAMQALIGIGLKARVPVDPLAFSDPRQREIWISEKNMQVFTLFSSINPLLAVDIFVQYPIPFEQLWAHSESFDLEGVSIRAACLEDLIAMKRAVLRPQDKLDIEALEALKQIRKGT